MAISNRPFSMRYMILSFSFMRRLQKPDNLPLRGSASGVRSTQLTEWLIFVVEIWLYGWILVLAKCGECLRGKIAVRERRWIYGAWHRGEFAKKNIWRWISYLRLIVSQLFLFSIPDVPSCRCISTRPLDGGKYVPGSQSAQTATQDDIRFYEKPPKKPARFHSE